MAKKERAESSRDDQSSSEKKNIIKLRLTAEQAKRIRVAAALTDKQPGAFARDAALEVAERVIAAEFR